MTSSLKGVTPFIESDRSAWPAFLRLSTSMLPRQSRCRSPPRKHGARTFLFLCYVGQNSTARGML